MFYKNGKTEEEKESRKLTNTKLAKIDQLKVKNQTTRKKIWVIYSKLTIKTSDRHHWRHQIDIIDVVLVSLLITLINGIYIVDFEQVIVCWVQGTYKVLAKMLCFTKLLKQYLFQDFLLPSWFRHVFLLSLPLQSGLADDGTVWMNELKK